MFDLLDAVRTKPPHPEVVGLADLIAQTLHKCNVPASVSVMLDISATHPPLRVDAQQIYQMLRNLISNGVEAMADDGTVQVESEVGKGTTFTVRCHVESLSGDRSHGGTATLERPP